MLDRSSPDSYISISLAFDLASFMTWSYRINYFSCFGETPHNVACFQCPWATRNNQIDQLPLFVVPCSPWYALLPNIPRQRIPSNLGSSHLGKGSMQDWKPGLGCSTTSWRRIISWTLIFPLPGSPPTRDRLLKVHQNRSDMYPKFGTFGSLTPFKVTDIFLTLEVPGNVWCSGSISKLLYFWYLESIVGSEECTRFGGKIPTNSAIVSRHYPTR